MLRRGFADVLTVTDEQEPRQATCQENVSRSLDPRFSTATGREIHISRERATVLSTIETIESNQSTLNLDLVPPQ